MSLKAKQLMRGKTSGRTAGKTRKKARMREFETMRGKTSTEANGAAGKNVTRRGFEIELDKLEVQAKGDKTVRWRAVEDMIRMITELKDASSGAGSGQMSMVEADERHTMLRYALERVANGAKDKDVGVLAFNAVGGDAIAMLMTSSSLHSNVRRPAQARLKSMAKPDTLDPGGLMKFSPSRKYGGSPRLRLAAWRYDL